MDGKSRAMLAISLLLLAGLSCLQSAPAGAVSNPLRIELYGPAAIAMNNSTTFRIHLAGGPADGSASPEWSYVATLAAEDWSGGPSVAPKNASSAKPDFNVTVKAGDVETALTLQVDATSTSGTDIKTATRKFTLTVVEGYPVSVTVKNTGQISASGVVVAFLVDGVQLENKTLTLAPGASSNLTFLWTTYTSGKHTLEVRVDSEDDIVELDNGDNVKRMTVYITDEPHPLRLVYVLIVLVLVSAMLLTTFWAKKKKLIFA